MPTLKTDVIEEMLASKGFKQAEFAVRAGINPSSFYSWMKGIRNPKLEAIEKIAKTLHCGINEVSDVIVQNEVETEISDERAEQIYKLQEEKAKLRAEKININPYSDNLFPKKYTGGSNAELVLEQPRRLPVISLAAAAECRPGCMMPLLECVNEKAEDDYAQFYDARSGDFVIRVAGDSMLPWYPSGTLILCRPEMDIENGKRVIAVTEDGEVVFKVFVCKNGKIGLLSIDDSGKDFIFPENGEGLRYICRVVASQRNEDALDIAMSESGIHHRWEEKLKNM